MIDSLPFPSTFYQTLQAYRQVEGEDTADLSSYEEIPPSTLCACMHLLLQGSLEGLEDLYFHTCFG